MLIRNEELIDKILVLTHLKNLSPDNLNNKIELTELSSELCRRQENSIISYEEIEEFNHRRNCIYNPNIR